MGPPESPTPAIGNQDRIARKQPARRPRTRLCLLKGCEQRFRPQWPRERYCSDGCRRAARKWSRWKAQQSYRATAVGKEKRNGQSRRYRERVRNRRRPTSEAAVPGAARVITLDFFSATVATGPAVTRASRNSSDRPPRGSVRARAGAQWSEFGGASGAGAGPSSSSGTGERQPLEISLRY
jgi:hypothetical protein